MAVSGKRRFDDDRVVRYETAEKNFEVEVARTLNKWCVTVYHLPDKAIVAQEPEGVTIDDTNFSRTGERNDAALLEPGQGPAHGFDQER